MTFRGDLMCWLLFRHIHHRHIVKLAIFVVVSAVYTYTVIPLYFTSCRIITDTILTIATKCRTATIAGMMGKIWFCHIIAVTVVRMIFVSAFVFVIVLN